MVKISECISRIFENNDPRGAAEELMQEYPDMVKAYRRWYMVRQQIRLQDQYRHPDFHYHIAGLFLKNVEMTEEVEKLCQELLTSSLQRQHFILNKSVMKRFMAEHLPDLLLLNEKYYLFVLPPEYQIAHASSKTSKAIDDLSIVFKVDGVEALRLRDTAINFLRVYGEPKSYAHCRRVMIAAAFLSGRRVADIIGHMTFEPGTNEYQATVSNLSKHSRSDKTTVIPLLGPFFLIKNAIESIRRFRDSRPTATNLSTWTSSSAERRAVFGKTTVEMTHANSRSLYTEIGFRERKTINLVNPHIENQAWWAKMALGIHSDNPGGDTTIPYSKVHLTME